jgi:hypothetical protein
VATGRHPPPPRVAGPAEAQLTRKGQLRLLCGLEAYIARMVNEAPYQPATSQACEDSQCQPIARFLRCTALRSKNSAWLTSADTVDCWYGLETRNAGSGRSPVRKRSG